MTNDALFTHLCWQIKNSPVFETPFAHIVIDPLLPDACYAELMQQFPQLGEFRKAIYPGTGHGRRVKNYHEHGLVLSNFKNIPLLACLSEFLRSKIFAQLMFAKFTVPLSNGTIPIPLGKRRYFEGVSDYSSRFDLYIDRPGYELPPHPDSANKIVTYQLFLNEVSLPDECGTMLCRPKGGLQITRRGLATKLTGMFLDLATRLTGLRSARLYKRLEQSQLGLALGLGANHGWMPWKQFELAKAIQAQPNSLIAFAPSEVTYHAVRLPDLSRELQYQRRVLRGFIRSGANASNWLTVVDDESSSQPKR